MPDLPPLVAVCGVAVGLCLVMGGFVVSSGGVPGTASQREQWGGCGGMLAGAFIAAISARSLFS